MCALVRERGADVVHVDIDNDKSVSHLKDAIKAKMPSRITCDTVDMHLFLAMQKQGKKWLSSRTNAVKKLKMGQKTDHVKTLMKEDQELQAEDSLKDMLDVLDPPLTGQIHVLVLAPGGAGKFDVAFQAASGYVPRVNDSSLEYFMLQNTDMDGLGLPQDQVMLYCRPAFHSQFDFLIKQVLDEGTFLAPRKM